MKYNRRLFIGAGLCLIALGVYELWPRGPRVVNMCSAVASSIAGRQGLDGTEVVFADQTEVDRGTLQKLQAEIINPYLAAWQAKASDTLHVGPGFYGGRVQFLGSGGSLGRLIFPCNETPEGGFIFVEDLIRDTWVFAACPDQTKPPAGYSLGRAVAAGIARDGDKLRKMGINRLKGPDGKLLSLDEAGKAYAKVADVQDAISAKFSGRAAH